MTCMDKDSEEWKRGRRVRRRVFVLQKSARIPRYDEAIEERGFDNVEYTEKIRNASRRGKGVGCRHETGNAGDRFLLPN